jgi:hypothetical protein
MNPLNTADRKRSIGSGNEISNVSGTADSLGYAFWSYANLLPLSSVGSNTGKYLTVDGVDPLLKGGVIPTCGNPVTPPCPAGGVDFSNVANGSYPMWTIFRIVTASTVPTGVQNLVNAAQTEVVNIEDFLPIASVQVFRSHFAPAAVGGLATGSAAPKNGNRAAPNNVEVGGDVGGMPFFKQADLDYFATFAKELVTLKQ